MEQQQRRYHPKQLHILRLKRGSAIVALDGRLEIRYRDGSLDWLADSAPVVSRLLEEGDRHVFPRGGYVEIYTPGATAVTGLVLPPLPAKSWVAVIAQFLSRDVLRLKRRNTEGGSGLSVPE
jgi:hypothetical protein